MELNPKATVTPISKASSPSSNQAPVSIGKLADAPVMLPSGVPVPVLKITPNGGSTVTTKSVAENAPVVAPVVAPLAPALIPMARSGTEVPAITGPTSIVPIVPHMSCKCFPEDLQNAIDQGYNEIYIFTTKGVVKHHKLRGQNRFVRLAAKQLPPTYKEVDVAQAINFLPAGKVPYELYEQVESFFRQVIKIKGAALEAMIFVMWNKERGYFLFVPKQTVAGASVNYTTEDFPVDSNIIINIHSHGHMGAFFSSTDDNNDRTMVQFSGVIGKFQDPVVESKWRFNYYDQHRIEVKIADMFQVTKAEVSVPEDWITKVSQTTYGGYQGGHGGYQGWQGGGRGDNTGWGGYPHTGSINGQGGHSKRGNVPVTTVENLRQAAQTQTSTVGTILLPNSGKYQYTNGEGSQVSQGSPRLKTRAEVEAEIRSEDLTMEFHNFSTSGDLTEEEMGIWWETTLNRRYGNDSVSDPKSHMEIPGTQKTQSTFDGWDYDSVNNRMVRRDAQGNIIDATPAPDPVKNIGVPDEEGGPYLGKSQGEVSPLDETEMGENPRITSMVPKEMLPGYTDGTYDTIAINHGVRVADAWLAIDSDMYMLEGKDELLSGLISDMFEFTSSAGQAKIIRELYEKLTPTERRKIETFGM